jgi:hypothetical protein
MKEETPAIEFWLTDIAISQSVEARRAERLGILSQPYWVCGSLGDCEGRCHRYG